VEVIYARDPNVGNGYQAYCGRLQGTLEPVSFEGWHFEELLRQLNRLMPLSDDTLLFVRTDRLELAPYKLEDDLVILIKTDVEQAIQRMSHPDVRIEIGRRPEPPAMLTSCGGTLAGAFGEQLLSRGRYTPKGDAHVECPVCGSWQPYTIAFVCDNREAWQTFTMASHSLAPIFELYCPKCEVRIELTPVDAQWVSFSVRTLLATKHQQFFFPREWNNGYPWVSREKLETLYKNFLANKETFNECL
jgi:hypothetical protein